jgi:hypothetical protein
MDSGTVGETGATDNSLGFCDFAWTGCTGGRYFIVRRGWTKWAQKRGYREAQRLAEMIEFFYI